MTQNLCVDLERTFVDRIYSNLELGNVNLPKRTIVYTNGGFFGTPVYIAPGEELTKKITQAGLDTTLPRNNSESPFGSCSEKTIQKSGGPKTGSEEKGNEAQQRPKPNAKKGEATSSEVEAARDEAQKTQKFLMIVFAIILMFVAYKWAIKPNI